MQSTINNHLQNSTMRWIITGLYTILIYSTLGIVRPLTETIRATGNLGNLTILLIGLFLFSLLTINISKLSKKQVILRLILIACFITLTMTVTRLPEERIHVIEYGLLGLLIGWSQSTSKSFLIRIILGTLLGWTIGFGDEIIQYFLPNRVYDIRDVILNGISTMLGLIIFFTSNYERKLISNTNTV